MRRLTLLFLTLSLTTGCAQSDELTEPDVPDLSAPETPDLREELDASADMPDIAADLPEVIDQAPDLPAPQPPEQQCSLDCSCSASCEDGVVSIETGAAWEGPCSQVPLCPKPDQYSCPKGCAEITHEGDCGTIREAAFTFDMTFLCAPE